MMVREFVSAFIAHTVCSCRPNASATPCVGRCCMWVSVRHSNRNHRAFALQGASQTLSRSDTAARQAKRKQQLLEAQLARISAVSGRPVTALGAPGLVLSSLDLPPRPKSPSAFGYIKPQSAVELHKETALLRVRYAAAGSYCCS